MRSAIVGTGFIGTVHARAVRAAGGTVSGVAASTPSRSADAAERLFAGRAATAEDLVTADDVDVVHVCTPNHLHVPLVARALAPGKHVICEKPLATALAGARHLTALAASAGLVAAVPFVYRFYPTVREARTRIASGGPLHLLHGSYLQDWLSRPEDGNWRVDASLGGAPPAVGDIGGDWGGPRGVACGPPLPRVLAPLLRALSQRGAPGRAPLPFA